MALMSQPKICHTNLLQIKYYHTNVRFLSQAFPRIDGICKLIVILLPLFTCQSIKERVISFHSDQPREIIIFFYTIEKKIIISHWLKCQ